MSSFRSFYKYVSADVAKTVLSTRTLRWSSPVRFDDPFDIRRELRLDFSPSELEEALNVELAHRIEKGDSVAGDPEVAALLAHTSRLEPKQRLELAAKSLEGWTPRADGQYKSFDLLKKIWSDLIPSFRVLCLSASNDITSMWSQYADHYQGAVLEFNARNVSGSCFLLAREVKCDDEPPAIATVDEWVKCLVEGDMLRFFEFFEEYEHWKTRAWLYQQEWRIVVPGKRKGETGTFSDYPFDARELTGVYLGYKMSGDDKEEQLSLVDNRFEHASVYEATIDKTQGRFAFSEIRPGLDAG